MAIKTFTTGEVLTASDTNTYLANSGLVYVTSATIGTAVSSVTVSNCFTSTYNGYFVAVHGGTSSVADENVSLQLTVGGTASTTGYYGTTLYTVFGSVLSTQSVSNGTTMTYAGGLDSRVIMQLQIFNPAVATSTTLTGPFIRQILSGTTSYIHRVNTAYDGFKISPTSGTLTGGTITVYGYRNA
jgi:hypothetical protein